MAVTTYKWTVERYHQAIDAGLFDDQPVELLRGEIVVMPPEREPHAYYTSEVGDYLRALFQDRAKIREAHPITLPNNSEPIPDLVIVKPLGSVYLERHPYPKDIYWVVEFSNSTLEKDLGDKRIAYGEAGVGEYWVVNLRDGQLHVFRDVQDGDYDSESILKDGAVASLAFTGVLVQVSRLLNP
jgi:Uma2 family endonuclease